MLRTPIDVWDIETFDDVLLSHLRTETRLILRYFETEQRNDSIRKQVEIDRKREPRQIPCLENPFAKDYVEFRHQLIPIMAQRSIRAWHYTRLTDTEAQNFKEKGPLLSDLAGIRGRLDALVADGILTSVVAGRLWQESCFHAQDDYRSGDFWAVSNPSRIDDGDVEPLLRQWGGEGVHFSQEDPDVLSLLRGIGKARIVEIEVPLEAADDASYYSTHSVICTFARSIGLDGVDYGFDICIKRSLGPQSVLAVHSDGDADFEEMAQTYPARFAKAR